jgi:hypothetical protein
MANLTSLFDVLQGWPASSALSAAFKQKAAVSPDITEGKVVAVEDETNVPVVNVATSSNVQEATGPINNPDNPWLVIQGADQSDSSMSGKLVCLKLRSGLIFKVTTALDHDVGDLVYSNAGVLTSEAHATAQIGATGVYRSTVHQAVGKILQHDATLKFVVVES